jgi:hypothetical protein
MDIQTLKVYLNAASVIILAGVRAFETPFPAIRGRLPRTALRAAPLPCGDER